ncbi:MAG: hypothetical protein FWD42_09520 [Solirubrobacterales bacterium]|nr:hypothetical protein [Solirubrobacterales bacterium]
MMTDRLQSVGAQGAQPPGPPAREPCAGCHAPLRPDQRYCLQCGARRGAPRLDFTAFWRRSPPGPAPGELAPGELAAGELAPGELAPAAAGSPHVWRPSRALGVVLAAAFLAAGLGAGAAIGPSRSAGAGTDSAQTPQRLLASVLPGAQAPKRPPGSLAPAGAAEAAPALAPAGTAAEQSGGSETSAGGAEPHPPAHAGGPQGAQAGEAASAGARAEGPGEARAGAPRHHENAPSSPGGGSARPPARTRIAHVWVIALGQGSFSGVRSQSAHFPYLEGTLVREGTLLTHFALVARAPLANDIALLSGQGPNPATEQNCATYEAVQPPTLSGPSGLATGSGCVYPAAVGTLAGQVSTAGGAWRAYAQDMSSTAASAAGGCAHPPLGAPNLAPTPSSGQDYASSRNPFVYFDSLLEGGACASDDVDLARLEGDLGGTPSTPSLAWIIPAACDDGLTAPCAGAGPPPGTAPADSFLRGVVSEITATSAYRGGGLIVITFDSAPAAGPAATVGALLLSPFVHRAARVNARFDDFSLLKSLERLYGVPLLGHAADAGVSQIPPTAYGSGAGG